MGVGPGQQIVDPTGGSSGSGALYGPWDEQNQAERATHTAAAPEVKARNNPGRKTAKKQPRAQQRKDKPVVFGKADRQPNLMRRYRFRVVALRSGLAPELLTTVEDVTWEDGAAIVTGSMTVRDPSFGIGNKITLREGDRVRLFMDGGGGFKPIWTMRVYAPGLSAKEGQRRFKLANDLDLLRRSTDDFVFPKDRAHPNGWTGDEMIREICRLYGVAIGGIPKFKFRRKKSVTYAARKQAGTGLVRLLEEICNVERQHTGRRYAVHWEQDALWIRPFTRSPHLLALGPSLIDAAFESALPQEDPPSTNSFASAITIRSAREIPAGTDKNGKKKGTTGKARLDLESAATRKRYGYVHRVVWSPDADTLGELREHGLQYLAIIAKPKRTLSLTHAGMPELRRGDAIRLGIGDDALMRQVVWVEGLQYTLSPTDFQMTVTCAFDDPYVDKKEERIGKLLSLTAEEGGGLEARQEGGGGGEQGAQGRGERGHVARADGDGGLGGAALRPGSGRGGRQVILGNPRPGSARENLGAGQKWVCRFTVPVACRLAKLSVRLDGLGTGQGTQVARPIVYRTTGALAGSGDETAVADGQAAGWVDFPFLGAHPGGLALAQGDHDFGLLGGGADQVIRLYGEPAGGAAKYNADSYADGPSDPFGSGTARAGLLALTGAIFLPAAPAPGADDYHLARLAFPDAQAALGTRPAVRATGRLTRAGWHGTTVHPERGSFVVARTGFPYAKLVGQRVKVTTRGAAKPRSVYALVATEADVTEEVSLSRRLFLALEAPGLTDVGVVVEEVSEE